MALITISKVAKACNISTRTLRYYEEIGLIESCKKEDYAYRVYDEVALQRIQLIIVLRKLMVSIKDIKVILDSKDTMIALEVLNRKLKTLDAEQNALDTIRDVLVLLLGQLKDQEIYHPLDLLEEQVVIDFIHTQEVVTKQLKEKKTMADVKQASDQLNTIRNPRIMYFPPMTVASSWANDCPNPEELAGRQLNKFVKEHKLYDVKKDLRVFGFNNPSPNASGDHGYEFYVTIPHDMDVKRPMVKKHFEGGLYAVHCIKMGDFHEWSLFTEWINNNKEYEYELREPFGMKGSLEEHLNAYSFYKHDGEEFKQLDLMIPVKKL